MAGTIVPLSSDLVMIAILLTGANPLICLVVATAGNGIGSLVSFGMGWLGKWEWLEKWFKVKREKIEQQRVYVEKYGIWLALFSWVPFVGDVGIIALGFYKTSPWRTALLIFIGCFVRFSFWIILNHHLIK